MASGLQFISACLHIGWSCAVHMGWSKATSQLWVCTDGMQSCGRIDCYVVGVCVRIIKTHTHHTVFPSISWPHHCTLCGCAIDCYIMIWKHSKVKVKCNFLYPFVINISGICLFPLTIPRLGSWVHDLLPDMDTLSWPAFYYQQPLGMSFEFWLNQFPVWPNCYFLYCICYIIKYSFAW